MFKLVVVLCVCAVFDLTQAGGHDIISTGYSHQSRIDHHGHHIPIPVYSVHHEGGFGGHHYGLGQYGGQYGGQYELGHHHGGHIQTGYSHQSRVDHIGHSIPIPVYSHHGYGYGHGYGQGYGHE